MESSSSSFVGLKPKYDVFLSFRGEDTRKNFVSHLYNALTKKGVHTFRDDRSLEKGKTIKDELFEAIEESQLSVIVLSKNYASSGWCLEELVKIIECKIHRKQIVIPIFYGVDETVKCSIIDRFAEAFAKREEADSKDGYYVDQEERVKSWRKALTEAINESGWDISEGVQQYGNEADCIEQIVKEIVGKLRDHQVEKEEMSKLEEVNSSPLASPLQHLQLGHCACVYFFLPPFYKGTQL